MSELPPSQPALISKSWSLKDSLKTYREKIRPAIRQIFENPAYSITKALNYFIKHPGDLISLEKSPNQDQDDIGMNLKNEFIPTGISLVPESIDSISIRSTADIIQNGIRAVTINTAGLGFSKELNKGGYLRGILNAEVKDKNQKMQEILGVIEENWRKLLDTIHAYDVITLNDFPNDPAKLRQLQDHGFKVTAQTYMTHREGHLRETETYDAATVELINCNRLGIPTESEIYVTPHFQNGDTAKTNGYANWDAFGSDHNADSVRNSVTASLFAGQTVQTKTVFPEHGLTLVLGSYYYNPAGDPAGRKKTTETSIRNQNIILRETNTAHVVAVMQGDLNPYGVDMSRRVLGQLPSFPFGLALALPNRLLSGENLPNQAEILFHHEQAGLLSWETNSHNSTTGFANTMPKKPLPILSKIPEKYIQGVQYIFYGVDVVFTPKFQIVAKSEYVEVDFTDHLLSETTIQPALTSSINQEKLPDKSRSKSEFRQHVQDLEGTRDRNAILSLALILAFAVGSGYSVNKMLSKPSSPVDLNTTPKAENVIQQPGNSIGY